MTKPATSAARLEKPLSCSARSSTSRLFFSTKRAHSCLALSRARCSKSSARHLLSSSLPKMIWTLLVKLSPRNLMISSPFTASRAKWESCWADNPSVQVLHVLSCSATACSRHLYAMVLEPALEVLLRNECPAPFCSLISKPSFPVGLHASSSTGPLLVLLYILKVCRDDLVLVIMDRIQFSPVARLKQRNLAN